MEENKIDYKLYCDIKKIIELKERANKILNLPELQLIKKVNLKLSDRIYNCDICNYSCDRDLNASLNILKEGKKQLTKLRIENKVGMNLPDLAA